MFDFEAILSGSYVKIIPSGFQDTISITEYRKQQNVQHYIAPVRDITINSVIRGLFISTDVELFKNNSVLLTIIKTFLILFHYY